VLSIHRNGKNWQRGLHVEFPIITQTITVAWCNGLKPQPLAVAGVRGPLAAIRHLNYWETYLAGFMEFLLFFDQLRDIRLTHMVYSYYTQSRCHCG
jgi:hypothetical protein